MTILMTGGDRPLGEPYFCDECGFSLTGCVCDIDLDDEDDHEVMGFCDLPDCCMGFQPHFPSECYTPEMYEAMVENAEANDPQHAEERS